MGEFPNINSSLSIAASIIVTLQGAAQFGAATANSALESSNGLPDLAALGILFVVLAFAVGKGKKTYNEVKHI